MRSSSFAGVGLGAVLVGAAFLVGGPLAGLAGLGGVAVLARRRRHRRPRATAPHHQLISGDPPAPSTTSLAPGIGSWDEVPSR